MKHEWKKQEKELYGAKQIPALITIPRQSYIMISGKGNPNCEDFSVYPLEGVWKQKQDSELIKENLAYTIMIRQPDFITEAMVNAAMETVKKKKPNPLYEEIRFEAMEDGTCVEMLHAGAFDDEPASFEKMQQFAEQNGLKRDESCHREIYLNNAKRTEKSKLKTILRFSVE